MSVKKQIPSLCKLYSFYEETPWEFLDETDVDSYFYHNLFDISQSQHRIVRVSRGSNKKSFAIKLFQFCDLKTEQRYILQEEVNISKRELTCLVDNLHDFLKTVDQASKCIQIPLPKPKVEIGSTKSKDNLFVHHYNDIIDYPIRKIRLSFRFGNNNSSIFHWKVWTTLFFQSKIWRVVNILNQNLMRCIIFISKSDTLYRFLSKICFSLCIFRFSLNFIKLLPTSKNDLLENDRLV